MKQLKNNILVVIVLYKIELYESITYNSFIKSVVDLNLNYEILIFNNSSDVIIKNDFNHVIVNSTINERLSGAYNYALNYATEQHKDWLLLLDQDTIITRDYFVKLQNFFQESHAEDIVAVVPFLREKNRVLSPQKINFFGWWQHKILNSGYQKGRVSAFNSLSLLKVEFLNSIGGFNEEYPLDMLDHWYYLQIYKLKKIVYVLNTYIEHELSVSNYESKVSLERHFGLLKAEKSFTKELGKSHYFTYKIRLIFRLFRQTLFFKDKRYAKLIFQILINKL